MEQTNVEVEFSLTQVSNIKVAQDIQENNL